MPYTEPPATIYTSTLHPIYPYNNHNMLHQSANPTQNLSLPFWGGQTFVHQRHSPACFPINTVLLRADYLDHVYSMNQKLEDTILDDN